MPDTSIGGTTLRMHANQHAYPRLREAVRADTENTLFQFERCAMDLAPICAALLRLMGLGGRTQEHTPAGQDPADMGTAYGLEASLAPTPSVPRSYDSDGGFRVSERNAWLRPH